MNKYIDKILFLSKKLHKPIVAIQNELDDGIEYFLCLEFYPTTSMNRISEFKMIQITDIVVTLNDQALDVKDLAEKLEKRDIIGYKTSKNNWEQFNNIVDL